MRSRPFRSRPWARGTPRTHWPAGHLAAHIIGGASWYGYGLTGAPELDTTWVRTPADIGGTPVPQLLEIDALLLDQATLPDEPVTFEDGGPRTVMRSTLLGQACLHAHRAPRADLVRPGGLRVRRHRPRRPGLLVVRGRDTPLSPEPGATRSRQRRTPRLSSAIAAR